MSEPILKEPACQDCIWSCVIRTRTFQNLYFPHVKTKTFLMGCRHPLVLQNHRALNAEDGSGPAVSCLVARYKVRTCGQDAKLMELKPPPPVKKPRPVPEFVPGQPRPKRKYRKRKKGRRKKAAALKEVGDGSV